MPDKPCYLDRSAFPLDGGMRRLYGLYQVHDVAQVTLALVRDRADVITKAEKLAPSGLTISDLDALVCYASTVRIGVPNVESVGLFSESLGFRVENASSYGIYVLGAIDLTSTFLGDVQGAIARAWLKFYEIGPKRSSKNHPVYSRILDRVTAAHQNWHVGDDVRPVIREMDLITMSLE